MASNNYDIKADFEALRDEVKRALVDRLHEMETKLLNAFNHYTELNRLAISAPKRPPED